jgi:hypothetical protein
LYDDSTSPKSMTLVVDQCAAKQYIGASSYGIYKIQDGKLIFAATEPGAASKPTDFIGGKGVRVFKLSRVLKKITGEELQTIVRKAVMTLSICGEVIDPRAKKALATLKELKEAETVKAIAKYLSAEQGTVRRSANYILWKGPFASIAPAEAELIKACSYPDAETRAMAAMALGGRKVAAAFKPLCDMTLNDKSPLARRHAACALSLLGNRKAIPILQKATKDKDNLVVQNAKLALTRLKMGGDAQLPPEVMAYILAEHKKTHTQAMKKGLLANWRIYGVDDRFNEYFGALERNAMSAPIKREIGEGHFSYIDLLPKVKGGHQLRMSSYLDAPRIENFFMVVPAGMQIVSETSKPISRKEIGMFDIYLYQREATAKTTNRVDVVLRLPPVPPESKRITKAKVATEVWLELLDKGKYAETWTDSAMRLQKAITKKKWVSTIGLLRGELGKVQSRKMLNADYRTSLPGAPDGEYVVLTFKTTFEKKKDAIETVTPMKGKDGKWRVSGYYVK